MLGRNYLALLGDLWDLGDHSYKSNSCVVAGKSKSQPSSCWQCCDISTDRVLPVEIRGAFFISPVALADDERVVSMQVDRMIKAIGIRYAVDEPVTPAALTVEVNHIVRVRVGGVAIHQVLHGGIGVVDLDRLIP